MAEANRFGLNVGSHLALIVLFLSNKLGELTVVHYADSTMNLTFVLLLLLL